jgi:uncharacterized membrane protein AbrB (regulator of aidB expression)
MKTLPAVAKTPSRSPSVLGPSILLAVFGASVLALPLPASLLGLALAVLGLRVGVMVTAAADEAPRAPARPSGPAVNEPALRAANG